MLRIFVSLVWGLALVASRLDAAGLAAMWPDDTATVCAIRIANHQALPTPADRGYTRTHLVDEGQGILRLDLFADDHELLFSIYVRDPYHRIWMTVPGPLLQLAMDDRNVLDRLIFVQRSLEQKGQYVHVNIHHDQIEKDYDFGSLHWNGDSGADGWEGKPRILLDIGEDVEEDFNMVGVGAFGELFYTAYYRFLYDSGSALDSLWQNYIAMAVAKAREHGVPELYLGLTIEEQVRRFFYYRTVWFKKLSFFEKWQNFIQHEFAYYLSKRLGDLPLLTTPTPQHGFKNDFGDFYRFHPKLVEFLWGYPLMDGVDLAWNCPPPLPRQLRLADRELFPLWGTP